MPKFEQRLHAVIRRLDNGCGLGEALFFPEFSCCAASRTALHAKLARLAAGPNYEGVAQAFFRPEFFNRIDAVVDFQPLSRATILAITRKELAEITEREGLVKAELRLTWSDRLVERLAAVGFDPRYGARPLQRAIEARVVAPLARWLVENPGVERRELRLDFGSDGTLEVL